MSLLLYIFAFILSSIGLWVASGIVISGIDHFSKNTRVSSFATSVLLLGIITSFTEISVGINAILANTPTVFVGNLIGGSFVVLLLVIPLLAIFSGGIELKNHLDHRRLLFFLLLLAAPSFLIYDGIVSRYDAGFLLLLYAMFFYLFQRNQQIFTGIKISNFHPKQVGWQIFKIAIGALIIYFAGKILVDSAMFFADALRIPPLLVSIFILAIGTNLPELSIAWNSILKQHSEIAFGDYIGSAAANPLLFGIFSLIYGEFYVNTMGFSFSLLIILFGYALFYVFARSKSTITVYEGVALLLVYLTFISIEITELLTISPEI